MLLDLDAFRGAPLTRDPFTFTVVKNSIRPADAAAIQADFPDIADTGLLPAEATRPGPKFRHRLSARIKLATSIFKPAKKKSAARG